MLFNETESGDRFTRGMSSLDLANLYSRVVKHDPLARTVTYDQLRAQAIDLKRTFLGLAKDNAKIDPRLLWATIRTIAGPFLLQKNIHDSREIRGEILSEIDKARSASTQHNMAEAFVAAVSKKIPDQFAVRMFHLVRRMNQIYQSQTIGQEFNLVQFWMGVRSETAIIHTLLENGYRVILPNYLSDDPKNPTADHTQEVLEWDVRKGIDLVAIDPNGNAFLIDAKGRRMSDEGNVRERVTVDRKPVFQRELANLPASLLKTLDDYAAQSVQRAKIIIPTDRFRILDLQSPKDPTNAQSYKDALYNFFSLREADKSDILTQLTQ